MWTVGSKPRLLRSLQNTTQALYPAPVHDRPSFLSLNGRDDLARLHSRTRSVGNFTVLGFGVRKASGLFVSCVWCPRCVPKRFLLFWLSWKRIIPEGKRLRVFSACGCKTGLFFCCLVSFLLSTFFQEPENLVKKPLTAVFQVRKRSRELQQYGRHVSGGGDGRVARLRGGRSGPQWRWSQKRWRYREKVS